MAVPEPGRCWGYWCRVRPFGSATSLAVPSVDLGSAVDLEGAGSWPNPTAGLHCLGGSLGLPPFPGTPLFPGAPGFFPQCKGEDESGMFA